MPPTFASHTQNAILRATATDDNSDVGAIQLSNTPDFAQPSEIVAMGPTTDNTWTLQSSGEVYGRVVDRAGNRSAETLATTHFTVYLPLIRK